MSEKKKPGSSTFFYIATRAVLLFSFCLSCVVAISQEGMEQEPIDSSGGEYRLLKDEELDEQEQMYLQRFEELSTMNESGWFPGESYDTVFKVEPFDPAGIIFVFKRDYIRVDTLSLANSFWKSTLEDLNVSISWYNKKCIKILSKLKVPYLFISESEYPLARYLDGTYKHVVIFRSHVEELEFPESIKGRYAVTHKCRFLDLEQEKGFTISGKRVYHDLTYKEQVQFKGEPLIDMKNSLTKMVEKINSRFIVTP